MQVNINHILRLLIRRWYVLLAAALLGALVAVGIYMSSTPTFQVSASLMLRTQDDNARPTDDMMRIMGLSGTDNVQDEVEVLSSRRIYGDAIRDLGLQTEQRRKARLRWVGEYEKTSCNLRLDAQVLDTMKEVARIDTRFDGSSYHLIVRYGKQRFTWKQKASYTAKDGETVHTIFGPVTIQGTQDSSAKPYQLRTTVLPLSVAVFQMQKTVAVVRAARESNIVKLSTNTDMPRRMEDFLTRVIDLYNNFSAQDKDVLAGRSAEFIAGRLRIVESQLDSIETAVEAYRKQHLITDLSQEGTMYMHASQSYETRLAELRTQERLIEYIRSLLSDNSDQTALIPANLGVQDGSLQNLIIDYNRLVVEHIRLSQSASENNPVFMQQREQIAQMRRNILKSLDGQKEGLEISISNLKAQQREWDDKISSVPTQEREYVELCRQQQLKEKLYLYLSQKGEESAVMLASQALPAKVIDYPAQLPEIISPKPLLLLFEWVVLMLFFAAAGILLADWHKPLED